MQISFGKKIPITTGQIYDNEKNKFVKATCYEYDCQNRSDIAEIRKLNDDWVFKIETLDYMKKKYNCNQQGLDTNIVVYSLESETGEILGLCCAENNPKSLDVKFFESKQDRRHKFVGQTLLASIGKQMLGNRQQKKLMIKTAIATAYDFYEKTCGFVMDSIFNSDLYMNRIKTYKFIKQTQQRTKAEIVNIQG